MIKNFIVIAFRNILKNKSFTFINIAGLSIGIASAVFILLFIISEMSYDRVYSKSDRIFRLFIDGKMSGSVFKGAWTSPPAGPVFMEEIDEIIDYTRIRRGGQVLVEVDEKKFLEENLVYADSGFLNIFDLPVIYGNPSTMLKEPNSMVLTESISKKYFGNQNPVGQMLNTDADSVLFKVTGVVSDIPDESHLRFNLIASYSTQAESRNDFWLSNFLYTYYLLDDKDSWEVVEEKMQPIMLKYLGPQLMQILGIDADQFIKSGNRYGLFLQPLVKVHLNPEIQGGFKSPTDEKYLMIFGLIAIFILIIASINFMNLSTAKATSRAKEVGMRKVVGSSRILLIRQFLWESVFLSLLSLFFSLILVEILLPYFNNMMELNLKMNYLSNWYTLPGLLSLTILVGILSGSYPAFILASFNPADVLKGKLTTGIKGGFLRNVLVVAQFSISIIIIIGTLVIYSQLRYFDTKDLGFTKENIAVIYRTEPIREKIIPFRQELEKNPAIQSTSNSSVYAGTSNTNNSYQIKGRDRGHNFIFNTNRADHTFAETYNIQIKEGRFFDPAFISDSSAVVVNETAIRKFEIDDPFSTVIIEPTEDGAGRELHIIGVVKDFHSASLHEEISPYIFQLKAPDNSSPGFISVRIESGNNNLKTAVAHMEKTWNSFTNDEPFQYFFLDERLNTLYMEEKRSGRLALVFAFLAILIASLGLFGLTMYNTQRRTREIGIRKVHGASSVQIVLLIVNEIIMLIVVSTIIAWIISYKISQNWLEDFAYRINLSPYIFIAGAGIAFLIALLTVSLQTYHAAQTNPARSLRHE